MSHYALVKIEIENPDLNLLRLTLEQMGATITVFIDGQYLKGTLRQGSIEVIVQNGQITLYGPDYAVGGMKQEIVQRYTTNGLQMALNKFGYKTQQQDIAEEKIAIKAVV